ncbi:hypothetical protein ABZP36_007126 [Zizania latifolia]
MNSKATETSATSEGGPLAKLQQLLEAVINSMATKADLNRMATKMEFADLSRVVAINNACVSTMEQSTGGGATTAIFGAARLGGEGIMSLPELPQQRQRCRCRSPKKPAAPNLNEGSRDALHEESPVCRSSGAPFNTKLDSRKPPVPLPSSAEVFGPSKSKAAADRLDLVSRRLDLVAPAKQPPGPAQAVAGGGSAPESFQWRSCVGMPTEYPERGAAARGALRFRFPLVDFWTRGKPSEWTGGQDAGSRSSGYYGKRRVNG